MASLTNKKIKDTYEGLIKTTDNAAISGEVELTDGVGNSTGISISNDGSLTATGEVSADTFVGDGSGLTNITGAVSSVNTQTGAVVLDTDDISEGTTNLYYTDTRVSANTDVVANTAKNSYPTADATKLAGIEAGAEVNAVTSVNTETGAVVLDADDIDDTSTTHKFTTASDISKLSGIESGAQVNTVDSVNGETGAVTLDTDDVSEGATNLYYTDSRADARVNLQTGANLDLSQKSTTDLSEGTNLYYTDGRADARVNLQTGANLDLSSKDTDDLSEGATNLYYTDARVSANSSVTANTAKNSYPTADATKLAGIEAGAEVNPTASEIKTAYESNSDTNAFTDAEKTKLSGIESGAEVNDVTSVNTQTGAVVLDADDIDDTTTTNKFTTASDITKLAGIEDGADVTDTANVTAAGALMDSEVDADIKTLSLPANTTISSFGASLVDDANASAARTTLGVDAAGTDNSTDVSLAGTPDYITISGQTITRNKINLATDVEGTLPVGNMSATALTTVQTASSQAAMLALTTQEGDVVVRTDENKTYMHNGGTAGTMADFTELATPTDAVTSVNGNTGAVTVAENVTTNLSTTANGTSLIINSSDGTNASIPAATTTAWGAMTDEDKTKLDSIETGAEVNPTSTDELTEGSTNLYYTDTRVAANSAVAANTAKNSYPSSDATKVGYISVTQAVDLDTMESNIATNNAKNSYPSADATKVGYISVTQAVDLDTIESNVATNNAKISFDSASSTKLAGIETGAQVNTVDSVNGATGTVSLDTADLTDVSTTAPSDGQVLQYDTTTSKYEPVTLSSTAPVDSVNGQTGAVVLDADDISDSTTTNKYTTASDITKLAGIEANADVTDSANVTTALGSISVTAHSDVTDAGSGSIITSAERTKLSGIETGADVTDTANVTTALGSISVTAHSDVTGAGSGSIITSAERTKLSGIESGAEVNTVDSVNAQTGVVVLDADDISDSTTTNKWATAAEKTKLGHISVTQAVDLDTMESNIATNNAKNSYPSADATKVGFISVTQVVDLDTMESNIATNNAKVSNVTTNLSTTANGTSLTVNSSDGTNASIPAATTSAWGAMTDEDKAKLDGIAAGATNVTNNNQLTNGAGYITDGNTGWNNTYGFITASSTNTLTNKSGNISQWTNDAGYTTNVGDITGVTAGTGLSGGGSSGSVTLNLDFSELTDKTTDISGTTEFIIQDGTTESRKAASEIKLSNFNNDSGWTSNVGDITAVTAGTNLTGGGTSGSVTLNMATGGVGAGTYGSTANGTKIDQITVDAYGRVTGVTTGSTGTGSMSSWIIKEGNGTETATVTNGETVTIEDGTGIQSELTSTSSGGTITITNTSPNVSTNLSTSTTTTSVTINSSDGTNATIGEATGSAAGVMSTAHHNKLDGIAAGATNVTNNNQLTNGAGYTTYTSDQATNTTSTPAFRSINLAGVTNPEITFNGTSDSGVDMAIKATPEGLDFYEPEDSNKVHFQILDDSGVNAAFGLKVGGTSVISSGRVLQNVTGNISQFTNDSGYITSFTNYFLNGISKSGNTLTFSVSGTTNQSYTFGSNAFNSTTIPTNNNQLTNGAGYITGYTETDTLSSVVARGSSTSNSITAASFIDYNNTSYYVNPASTTTSAAFAGNVGIGTTSPDAKLEIEGTVSTTSSDHLILKATNTLPGTPGRMVDFIRSNGSVRGYITMNQYGVTYNTSSDYRIKRNIVKIQDGIHRVKQLKPSRFNWSDGPDSLIVDGFIAHEAQEVVPEAVVGEKDGLLPNGEPNYQGIDQSKLVPLLTAALQEAIAKIEDLEARIITLETT